MQWIDPYSKLYQIDNGFLITVLSEPTNKKAYLSMKPTTRAAYDMSMRENTIDGIITMEENFDLKAGNIFFLNDNPTDYYIMQTCSYWEQQPDTRNINATRVNCLVTVQRRDFNDENFEKEEWVNIYENIYGYISETLKDSKNFNAGLEVATLKTIQIPKFNLQNKFYYIKETDKIIVCDIKDVNLKTEIFAESVDSFGIQGIIRVQGTQDMRNK